MFGRYEGAKSIRPYNYGNKRPSGSVYIRGLQGALAKSSDSQKGAEKYLKEDDPQSEGKPLGGVHHSCLPTFRDALDGRFTKRKKLAHGIRQEHIDQCVEDERKKHNPNFECKVT
jgi:hypothetical protein